MSFKVLTEKRKLAAAAERPEIFLSLFQTISGRTGNSENPPPLSDRSKSSTSTTAAPPVDVVKRHQAGNVHHRLRFMQQQQQQQPPVSYQSPISPIRNQKNRLAAESHYENHFMCSPLSRTTSLPILPGALQAVNILDDHGVNKRSFHPIKCGQSPIFSSPSWAQAFSFEPRRARACQNTPQACFEPELFTNKH